jgi:hypothetical protein
MFPTVEFTDAEVENIIKFVNNGGGLLLTGEEGNAYNNADVLNKVATKFGISFNKDRVIDPVCAQLMGSSQKSTVSTTPEEVKKVPEFIKITNFREHKITTNIREIAYFAGCSLDTKEEYTIAKTKLFSFSDMDRNGTWDIGERMGPMKVVCAAEYGKGRVVCSGDSSFFLDEFIDHADNKQFCMNILKWLAKII